MQSKYTVFRPPNRHILIMGKARSTIGSGFVYGDIDLEPIDGCFVLRPEKDPAALAALKTYWGEVKDGDLKTGLRKWIDAIELSWREIISGTAKK